MDLQEITDTVYVIAIILMVIGVTVMVLWARASRRSADPECRACGRYIMRGRLCAHCERHRTQVGAR